MQALRIIILSFTLLAEQVALAGDEIVLNAAQIHALGIDSAPLPDRQQGELSGMPAQVVIPASQLYIVSTPLPATVEQTAVGIGDHVRKGQLLARLLSPALVEAQRGLLQASTQAQLARENFSRDERLLKEGIIAESRYRSTQAQFVAAEAALAERKQILRLAGMSDATIAQLQSGANLSSVLAISSPIDGVILEKSASAGQRLEAAVPMFKVASLKPLELEIQVPLDSAGNAKVGAEVAIPAYGAKGKLIAIGGSLSGGNQTILMRALIREGTDNLRPGQYVEASIATKGSSARQWAILNGAVARIGSKSMVFVETSKGFRAEPVNVPHIGAEYSTISGNFKGDERIAIRGVSALKANALGIGRAE